MKKKLIIIFLMFSFYSSVLSQNKIVLNNKVKKNSFGIDISFNKFQSKIKDFNFYRLNFDKSQMFIDSTFRGRNLNFIYEFNQNPIYVFPGDTLIIQEGINNYIFKGSRQIEWNFIHELKLLGAPLLGFEGWSFNLLSKSDNFFQSAINKKDSILKIINSKVFSPNFSYLINRDINCSFLSTITRLDREMNKKNKLLAFEYFQNYEEYFLTETNRNSWAFYVGLLDWNQFLTNYKNPTVEKGISKTKYEFAVTDYDYGRNYKNRIEAAKLLKNPIRDEIIFELMRLKYRTNSWENVEEASSFLKYFQNNCENKEMIEEMNVLSGTFLKKNLISSNSKIWGETKMMPINEKITTWNQFVNENNGNVIYVDFWASWCGPCIKEIKESYEILKNFEKNKMKFVNISIDENLDFWKSSIKKLKIENDRMNFVIDPKSELAKYFKASESIPRHILIDKEGNIRTMMAPGANSIMFQKAINDLLIE